MPDRDPHSRQSSATGIRPARRKGRHRQAPPGASRGESAHPRAAAPEVAGKLVRPHRFPLVGTVGGPALDAVALAAGAALPFGFSPYAQSPWPVWLIPALSLAALFSVWLDASWQRAAWRGWLFGLGSFGIGVSWVHESFQYNHITGLFALVLAAGFVASLSLYPALIGGVASRLPVSGRAVRLLAVFPSAWVLGEWLRGAGLSGFTWLQTGYALVDSPVAGLLPVGGVYGAGLFLAFAAAVVAALWLRLGCRRAVWIACVVMLALVAVVGHQLLGRAWTEPAGAALEVALIQGNVPQDQKWKPEMRGPTLDRYRRLTGQHEDADLVVWPETAVPAFLHRMTDFLDEVAVQARRRDTVVMTGIPIADIDARKFINAVVMLGGAERGFYHKRHLVPFGEYLPLASVLRPITDALGIEVANFSPGDQAQSLLEVRGHPVGLFVCYEVSFGAEVRATLPEAELLVTVSNDAWFGTSIGPYQHLQIARARALESGRWLIRSTNTGLTVIVDPVGRVVARAPQFTVAALRGTVIPMTGTTPYGLVGDWPAFVVVVVALLGAVAGSRRGASR